MNSRFAIAVHVLTLIARADGEPVASERIAASVNTNASLIRRLLSRLARAGLTTARLGSGGGALLARPAHEITLCDVYLAMKGGGIFALHREEPNRACPVGRNIRGILVERFDGVSRAVEDELKRTTIADAVAEVEARAPGRRGRRASG